MSRITNVSDAWTLMRELAAKVGAKSEISNADVEKLLKTADKDKNGVITEKEFTDAFQNSEDFKKFEADYVKAFKLIAELDGTDGMSLLDIQETVKNYEKLVNTSNNDSDDETKDPTPPKNDPPKDTSVKTVGDLSGKELSVLQSERAGVLSQIDSLRSEKASAIATAEQNVQTTQAAFNEATAKFIEMRQEKLEKEAETNEKAKQVLLLEDTKNAVNDEISNKKSEIATATTTVTTIKSSISSLVAPPETISYTDEETKETVTQRNPEYDAYLAKKAALEEELAAAEVALANLEDELEALEEDLSNVENDLTEAIKAYAESEEVKNTLTEEEKTALANIDTTKAAYNDAKVAKNEISSKYDASIDTLQDNLRSYNDAITAKKFEIPKDYSVKDGVITNGTDNLQLLTDLPNNAEAKDDGTIVDKETGKVIGFVTGSGDEKQMFLKVEKEPESTMTFSQQYIAARTLFDNNENWQTTDFSEYTPSDIKKIKELYNGFVTEHNDSVDEEGAQKTDFDTAAKTNMTDTVAYKKLTSLLDTEYKDVTVSTSSFISHLQAENIDISQMTPAEIEKELEKYVVEKYKLQDIDKYYPFISNEKVNTYFGEDGIESIKGADENTINATVDKIVSDTTLTPFEKIQLLEMIKSASVGASENIDKIFAENDSFFYDTFNEMMKDESGTYSPSDVIEFIRQYKVLDNNSTVLGKGDLVPSFIEEMATLYQITTEPNEKLKLEQLIGSDAIINLLPEDNYKEERTILEENGLRIEENVPVILQNLGIDPNATFSIDEKGNINVQSEIEGIESSYVFDSNGRLLSYNTPFGNFVQKEGKIFLEHTNKKGEKVETEFPAGDIETIVKAIQSADAEKILTTIATSYDDYPEMHKENYCVKYTQAVLKELGIDIPNYSYGVYKNLEKVEAANLQPGDLYLSTNYPASMSDSNQFRHVGVVVAVTPNEDGSYTYVTIDYASSGVSVNVHNTSNPKETWFEFRRPKTE